MEQNLSNSQLNRLIPPEIKNDELYLAIHKIARQEDIKTVLEIGSSSGQGSTEAFVTGLRENPSQPVLFCMEISKPRFAELQNTYRNDSFVKCYNVSSVSIEQFAEREEVIRFYRNHQTNLNYYPLEQVLGWLSQDIEYVKKSGVLENGIKEIKKENDIDVFDAVLIDGSEFTGNAELEEVYGAKIIILDDINTFKNYRNHNKLLTDPNYVLVGQNYLIRNGYAIFKKNTFISVGKAAIQSAVESNLSCTQEPTIYFNFETEKSEQLLVKNIVRFGMVVFDVGANIGDYSILFSQLVGNCGKVYSFEPTGNIFIKLQERVKEYGFQNISLFQKAIYSENKQIEFNEFPDEYSVWNSIGKPKMMNPEDQNQYIPLLKKELVEAITLDSFCQSYKIQFIDYLKLDVEGAESDALEGAIGLLTKKAIRFIQFEISQKMLEGLNRQAQETFDLLIKAGYECNRIKEDGQIGEQVIGSTSFYENYIAFPALPIHFFTIVLNGEPFIRYHIEAFKQLPFKWHWHIIEGVAELKHDTAWSLRNGGRITDEIHCNGRSNDGTAEYLDELAQLYPENVTVYRKPEGIFWEGKREMVNAPLENINEECLLWQVDVDELWTVEQIGTARQMFIYHPEKTAAFYWCWYFVGEKLVISSRNCYAQNPAQEWLRTWRFKPGCVWTAHEPPVLTEPLPNAQWRDVAAVNPFVHEETEKRGLVFQHFAYAMAKQLEFKEQYYGYSNAVSEWKVLQSQTRFPVRLSQYFSWVQDGTMVDTANSCGVTPMAKREKDTNVWEFCSPDELPRKTLITIPKPTPTIIIDGVFFQLYRTGIARVWNSLLEEWAKDGFSQHIIILDRAGTAPKIVGIRYLTIPAYNYGTTDTDREMLQQVCDQEGADLFISTYYTTPLSTPSVFMAYDMIPEVLQANLNEPMWKEKHHAIRHASGYISISENTARDLRKFFPEIPLDSVKVAHCGVDSLFSPASQEEINSFKIKYGISKPYFLSVGGGSDYKNTILFFKAFGKLASKQGFEIVCTGTGILLEAELRNYTVGSVVHKLQLSDEELRLAYAGAVALIYPSKYEGFGMPVLEAMSCGCPVITCPNASIPEVAGEAALYVNDEDVEGLADALCEVQKPKVRNSLIAAGLEQAKKFSWSKMAKTVSSALIDATLVRLNLREINLIIFPDWTQPEEFLGLELERVVRAIATHSDKSKMTLLVDTSNVSEEDANLALSGVAMNLLMEQDLDVSDGPEISLIGQLSEIQWSVLMARLHGRIVLECENKKAIAQAKADDIPYSQVDCLPNTISC
ncbi:FkbM family methyltransferase [filamentous cyanobacterium Phorm 6]|nr:FkbM family methyltransferase [filamentous cyanobacterium Phorm 6]